MDPTTNMEEQRSLAAEILKLWDTPGCFNSEDLVYLSELARDLAERVVSLDEWVNKGVFNAECDTSELLV